MLTRSSSSWLRKRNDCAPVLKVPRVGASARKTTMIVIRQMEKLQQDSLTAVTNLTISSTELKKSLNQFSSKDHQLSKIFLEEHKTQAPLQMLLATRSWKPRWRYYAMKGFSWQSSCTKPKKERVKWRILPIMRLTNSMLLWLTMRALSKLRLALA